MKIKIEAFPWQELRPQPVIGVDEVGRGCLAGPVYAAAVAMDANTISHYVSASSTKQNHFKDSKALSALQRETLCLEIKNNYLFGLGSANVEEISRMNILWASLLAMKRAVNTLTSQFKGGFQGHVLVDGNHTIPNLDACIQTPLIKGDQRAMPIAAASIVAKVHRDQWMTEVAAHKYPNYGFEKHKGYSTATHKKAIAHWGPTEIHRPTFSGVKEFLHGFPHDSHSH